MDPQQAQEIAALIPAAKSGDPAALEELGTRLLAALYPGAKQLVGGNNLGLTLRTGDLIQEVIVRLLAGGLAHSPEDPAAVGRWLCTVMHNALRDHVRRRNAQSRRGAGQRVPLDDVVEYYTSRVNAPLPDVMDALDRLEATHPLQAEVVRLKFFGELTAQEIAAQLGLPVAEVNSAWRLARARLRDLLERPRSR